MADVATTTTPAPTTTTPLPSGYQSTGDYTSAQTTDSNGNKLTPEGSNSFVYNGNEIHSNVYNGSTYAPVQSLSKMLGTNYTTDPKTGAVTVNGKALQPIGYDQYGNPMVSIRQASNAVGISDDRINWDPNTHDITVKGAAQDQANQTGTPTSGNGSQSGSNYMNQLTQRMPQMPQMQGFQSPDLSSYYSHLMPYQQFNPDYKGYQDQAYNQVNPLYQQQANQLITKMNTDISASDESMNRRGIFTSGIAQAVENDIRTKTTSTVANVFMKEQGDIYKVAQQLYNQAFTQYKQGNQFALQNNQIWMNQAMEEKKFQFQNWLQTQRLSLDQYHYAMDSWDKMANLVQKDAQMQMQNQHFQQTQAWDQYKFGNVSATDQSKLNWDQYKFGNLSADQQVKNSMEMMKIFGTDGQGHPTLDAQKLQAEASHWANQDANAAQSNQIKMALGTAQLNQHIADQTQKAQEFSINLQNSQWKEQATMLNNAITAKAKVAQDLNQQIMYSSSPDPQLKQQLSDTMNQIDFMTKGLLELGHLSQTGTQLSVPDSSYLQGNGNPNDPNQFMGGD